MEEAFREGWTDNADRISILYTGTPALKTDFTRTGKRSWKGAVNDGVNAVQRYYINNFCDGYNHDCLDLALGKLPPTKNILQRSFLSPLKLTFFAVRISFINLFSKVTLGVYFLSMFLENYLPVVEENNKTKLLHYVAYGFTFLVGLVQVFCKRIIFFNQMV